MKPIPSILATLLLTGALPALAQGQQRDYSKVEIKEIPVAGSVRVLEGSGGNIGVSAGPDGLLIVDTQFAPLAERIDAALAKLGSGEIRYVVNTHIHGDHTGGNAYFGKKARIIAHANLRKRLAAKEGSKSEELPVITHDKGVSFWFNGEEVRVIAFDPGHTDGDSVVYFSGSKVLHLGDQFVNGRFPFVDIANGGNVKGFLKNIDGVLAWLPDDAKVIPGHGTVQTKAQLQQFRDIVAETIAIVEKGIAEGKSSEEVRAGASLEKYKDWSNGLSTAPRWFDAVYNGLNATR